MHINNWTVLEISYIFIYYTYVFSCRKIFKTLRVKRDTQLNFYYNRIDLEFFTLFVNTMDKTGNCICNVYNIKYKVHLVKCTIK